MLAAIHQPEHLPWMGYFHKIHLVDTFVILDNVQFKKQYFEHRNRIHTAQGLIWMTAKTKTKGYRSKIFCELELMDTWNIKYIKTLEMTYSKAPYKNDIFSIIDFIGSLEVIKLADLNVSIITYICNLLHIETTFVKASEMNVTGKKTVLLKSILDKIRATKYLVGKSGHDYLDKELMEDFVLVDHVFEHPMYTPFNFPKFHPYPSIIDVIANIGLSKTENILKLCG